jgi:hypothetical protein
MQKKIQIIALVLGCIAVIAFAIQAGRHHENCRECNLAIGNEANETANFSGAWK